MRNIIKLFLLWIALSFALDGCGTSQSVVPVSTTTSAPPSLTSGDSSPTITPVLLTPTKAPIPQGKTIIVTSAEDSGPGTLRQALLDAMLGDIITFDPAVFPPENPTTIFLKNEDQDNSALPNITQGGISIDASNAGVILDGSNITGNLVNGLEIYSDRNTIQGLQIINFSGSGIVICRATNNLIGGDRNLGTGLVGRGNVISMNGLGIELCEYGSENKIIGNLIGTDPTQSYIWGNSVNGIMINWGSSHNTVGPDNIIAHNGSTGVLIWGADAAGNTITQNSIYDNAFGIRLSDGNAMLTRPLISEFNVAGGTVSGSACANCIIEIYSTSSNEADIYEGNIRSNSTGIYSYEKGTPFTGPYLTVTATDAVGNTSELGQYYLGLQMSNKKTIIKLQPRQSNELEDNKIGIFFYDLWQRAPEAFPNGALNAYHIFDQGVTRARFTINDLDSFNISWDKPENAIEPSHDEFITTLADNGISLTYVLSFWDKEFVAQGGVIPYPRFKTEEEILRYLDYVRFIVHHLKNRVEYFEIWNEPNLEHSELQYIELEDYIQLVKRTVPVIRQEFPEAKIVVGGTGNILDESGFDYFSGIISSGDIMPLVDAISWHALYGTSPEHDLQRQFYYDYPSMVSEIKDTASAHGFEGDYIADELVWWTPATPGDPPNYHSETECAKYYARGIIMNLGMDVMVSQFYSVPNTHPYSIIDTIRNLSTTMAGAEPIDLPVEILSDATIIKSYAFSLPNGDNFIAVWNDNVAVDHDPGMSSTIILSDCAGQKATGIDVVYGFKQELFSSNENGDLVIHDFLLKDYPIIILLSK